MKKIIKPNLEFIFSVSLVAILGLPPLVLAQNQKSIEIKIVNSDTTVNGKDIKTLSAQERKEALAEMEGLPETPMLNNNGGNTNNRIVIKRKTTGNGKNNNIVIERSMDNNNPIIADFDNNDSSRKDVRIRLKRLKGTDSAQAQAFTYRFDTELPQMDMKTFSFDVPRAEKRDFVFNRPNTQTFSYSNTDKDGIYTNISFRVSDNSYKKPAGIKNWGLKINDLNLAYEFSTGKTLLSFNLADKTTADVKFWQGDIVVWSDKVINCKFSKKFDLPLNGVYSLQVIQGENNASKKIIKE